MNKKQKVLTCLLQEWKNLSIMESLFDFHLKRRTIINIDWYQLFVKWDKQESSLIELHNELQIIYTENYKFNIQELRAWNAFLHAVDAHDVTPWSNDEECQVIFNRLLLEIILQTKLIINFIISFNFSQNPAIQNKIIRHLPNYTIWDFLSKKFQCLSKIPLQLFGDVLILH